MRKKQEAARSREKSPARTKAATTPTAASDEGDAFASGEAKPKRVTLTEAAGLLLSELVLLRRWARSKRPGFGRQDIERIRQLLTVAIEPMQGSAGDKIAALGGPADTVSICGRCYPSAHHAAFGEAERLFKWLCIILETDAYDAAQAAALVTPMTPESIAAFDELHRRDNGTALNPSSVTSDWAKASWIILSLLPDNWLADSRTVGARLERERAAMKTGSPAAAPAAAGKAKGKRRPTAKTLAVIKLIEQGKSNAEIQECTSNSDTSIRQIRCDFNAGRYKL